MCLAILVRFVEPHITRAMSSAPGEWRYASDRGLLPMQDYHKAKRLLWDPRDIRLEGDHAEWPQRTPEERDSTLTLISLFHAGEEAVTHDLSPLLMAIRREGGHLEDAFPYYPVV